MVAIITTGYSIQQILSYNENKIKEGKAECISEGNYPMAIDKLTFPFKLNRFLKQLELNKNVTRNTVHISLNFHPSDRGLAREVLAHIADCYMEKIEFNKQPYLVYQHHDAGHPHLHVVSIIVRPDGSSINMFKRGITHSLPACREIEKKLGLVIPEKRKTQVIPGEPTNMSVITYGKQPTVKSLSIIVKSVLQKYHYTSLLDLNVLLRQYNIRADRGPEGSRMFKNGGLVYRILDTNGKAIGSYVKASVLHSKATLKFIEARFKENQTKRLHFKSRIQNAIDGGLLRKSIPLVTLMKSLEKQGIHMAVNQNDAGILQSVTYVDHQTKSIFNGEDLGKPYNAQGIQERCRAEQSFDHDPHYSALPQKKISLQVAAERSKHYAYTFNLMESEQRLNPMPVNELAKMDPGESEKDQKIKKRKHLSRPY